MKKNSIGFLVALIALFVTGCTPTHKKQPRRSSIVDDSSELSSASKGTSTETSEGTSVGTSIGTSTGTSAGTSVGTSVGLSSQSHAVTSAVISSATPHSSSAGASSVYISSATPIISSQTPIASSSVTPFISSATSHPSSSGGWSSSSGGWSSSSVWSSSSSTPAPYDPYYKECEGLSGSALEAKLKSINPPKNPSYDWSRYEDADEAEDDSTSILSIYTRHNIKKNSHCGSYAWDKWNREHIWTQSAWPASDKDNHNIFACEGQINNYRGNLPFAEGGETVVVFGHTTGCKMISGTSFEPCDEAKGEVARSVMYGTVTYTYDMTKEIDSIALALKWHLQHPISTREIKRNDVVYQNQGNRNPFVDHPEYACRIWGATNSETRSLCGM